MSSSQPSFEDRQNALDPHRQEERQAAVAEFAARLRSRRVELTGRETSDQLADLLTAVERFEQAVELRGGDLMVNTPGTAEPENRDFVLPLRQRGEGVRDYIVRIEEAADRVRHRGD